MPSFAGQAIFGRSPVIKTRINPRESQKIAAPGINGLGNLDLGSRGGVTTATGILNADTPGDLAIQIGIWESFKDGNYYALADNFGSVWLYTMLEAFDYQEPVRLDPYRGYWVAYQAEFINLIT
jgi:hypothetical protein